MLLYRPLLAAYRNTSRPAARRYILREMADPQLHADPAELLSALAPPAHGSPADQATHLHAEARLHERLLRLRFSSADRLRALGGLWTAHAFSGDEFEAATAPIAAGVLESAAGGALGTAALSLLERTSGHDRTLALTALGSMGSGATLAPLRLELATGGAPFAAALAIGTVGAPAIDEVVVPALQGRPIEAAAAWLPLALAGAPGPTSLALADRLARARGAEAHEGSAWALRYLGECPTGPASVAPVIETLSEDRDPFVRLNLLASLERLGVPGGRRVLQRLSTGSDPEILRTAWIRAAAHAEPAEVLGDLEDALFRGTADVRAEALQSLVALGVSGPRYVDAARRAAAGTAGSGRLRLIGLLALAVWAPDEALARITQLLAARPSADWFLAAYALRYVVSDHTVPLLVRLSRACRATELEELVVSALCRHLAVPGAVDGLFSIAAAGPAARVLRRMMEDLARHVPEAQAPAAAERLRGLLASDLEPSCAGPVLVALGALGSATDVPRIVDWLGRGAGLPAIHALELTTHPDAAAALRPIATGPPTAETAAATVALFRLGALDPSIAALERMSAVPDAVPLAARALFEIGLSVRCCRELDGLSALRDGLKRRAGPDVRVVAHGQPTPPGRPAPAAELEPPPAPERPRQRTFSRMLDHRRPCSAAATPPHLPELEGAPDPTRATSCTGSWRRL
jgi:hypothetical protein